IAQGVLVHGARIVRERSIVEVAQRHAFLLRWFETFGRKTLLAGDGFVMPEQRQIAAIMTSSRRNGSC
ncbi:MAG TPA: hypothetical protein VH189_09170, partial [Rhizomicrobium sp.]|nr:hypothetical protein [Rhizomicrobium sp.]